MVQPIYVYKLVHAVFTSLLLNDLVGRLGEAWSLLGRRSSIFIIRRLNKRQLAFFLYGLGFWHFVTVMQLELTTAGVEIVNTSPWFLPDVSKINFELLSVIFNQIVDASLRLVSEIGGLRIVFLNINASWRLL